MDDCVGPAVEARIASMGNGDVMLLENVRFHAGEEVRTHKPPSGFWAFLVKSHPAVCGSKVERCLSPRLACEDVCTREVCFYRDFFRARLGDVQQHPCAVKANSALGGSLTLALTVCSSAFSHANCALHALLSRLASEWCFGWCVLQRRHRRGSSFVSRSHVLPFQQRVGVFYHDVEPSCCFSCCGRATTRSSVGSWLPCATTT